MVRPPATSPPFPYTTLFRSVHDGLVLAPQLRARQSVDEHVRRNDAEPAEGALHGEDRGAADVQPVDLADAGRADGDRDGALPDLDRELLALQRGKDLGVVQATD